MKPFSLIQQRSPNTSWWEHTNTHIFSKHVANYLSFFWCFQEGTEGYHDFIWVSNYNSTYNIRGNQDFPVLFFFTEPFFHLHEPLLYIRWCAICHVGDERLQQKKRQNNFGSLGITTMIYFMYIYKFAYLHHKQIKLQEHQIQMQILRGIKYKETSIL